MHPLTRTAEKDRARSLPDLFGARTALPLLLVAAVSAGAYARTLSFDLVWDDRPLVTAIEAAVEEKGPAALLLQRFSTVDDAGGYYRPVTAASLWLDSRLKPVISSSFHLTNLVLHTLNSVLVYLLLSGLVARFESAWAGALLFAVHPVHVESVAFVSGRTDLLAAFFVLLSVLAWRRSRADNTPRKGLYLAAGASAFLAACLSKETAFVLPVLLLAWGLSGEGDKARPGRRLKDNLAWGAAWGAAMAAALVMRLAALGPDLGLNSLPAGGANLMPATVSPAMAAAGALQYMRLAVWPWPLKTFYTAADLRLTWPVVAGAALFLALATAAARSGRPSIWRPGVIWYFLFLLPVSGLFPRGGAVIAERFLYLPTIGLSVLLAALVDGRFRSRTSGIVLHAAVLAAAGVMVVSINLHAEHWRDNVALYTALSEDAPGHPIGPYNLGTLLSDAGAYQMAVPLLEEAVRRDSGHLGARFNLANSLAEWGRREEAESIYRQVMDRWPAFRPARTSLALLLVSQGRYGEARMLLEEGLEPDRADPRTLLGLVLAHIGQGERAAARAYFERLEEKDPHTAAKYENIVRSGDLSGTGR